MDGTYILVVDDESRIRKLLRDFFTAKGYQILEAEDGEKAIEVFEENRNKIKLILLDVMLPKMNGFDILKEIKNEGIETKVIMLTAKSMLEDKLYGFESGANDYITKPFHMDELVARVNAQLRNTVKIAKNIVSNYGGNITAHSENEYTTFKVFF